MAEARGSYAWDRKRIAGRTDWFRVLVDLQYHGHLSNEQVGARIDTPMTTVRGWKQGAEPRHHDGQRLLELWMEVTGKAYEDRPRIAPAEPRDSATATANTHPPKRTP